MGRTGHDQPRVRPPTGDRARLRTAATLWCAAATGCLAGAGQFLHAAVGALAVVLANVVLRPVARRIDRQPGPATDTETRYQLEAAVSRLSIEPRSPR